MRYFIYIIISIISTYASNAQDCRQEIPKKAQHLFDDAILYYQRTQFSEATLNLEKAIKNFPEYVDALMMLGNLIEANDINRSIALYRKAISIDAGCTANMYVYLAEALRKDQQYEEALQYFKKAQQNTSTGPKQMKKIVKGLADCTYAITAIKNPVPFNPQNLGNTVNSIFDDYLPSLTVDESNLIFARTLFTEGEADNINEDIFMCRKKGELWENAFNIGQPVNTDYNEGAQTVSADGKYIFFTRCNSPDGAGSCDLYVTLFENTKWSKPYNLGPTINTKAWESQPCISSDGKTIYFCSTRAGGYGGSDIWKASYINGAWERPINLGKIINTEYDEKSPFIHPDNVTLYYNSEGHPGFGNLDFFVSRLIRDTIWTKPMNLGYPINSPQEERSIFVNARGNTAYISSDRSGGFGLQDIYAFELYPEAQPQIVSYIKGRVYDANSKAPLGADISLIDLQTGQKVMTTYSDNISGEYLVTLIGGRNYAYSVDKKNYLFSSENFELKNTSVTDPLILDIPLKPVNVGETVILRNIFFDSNSFSLLDESKFELNKLVALLKNNKTMKIEIIGHTDNVGSDSDNIKLSTNRAAAVVTYLQEHGIDFIRLSSKGMGETSPIADNETNEGRSKNRRTEFKVVGN